MASKTGGLPYLAAAHHQLAGTASRVIIAAQLANQRARAGKCQHFGVRFFTTKGSAELANTHHLLLICGLLFRLLLTRAIHLGILLGGHYRPWLRTRRNSTSI